MNVKLLKLDVNYDSEHELYFKLIQIHNMVFEWGLTPTQIHIIIYLIRYGYNNDTKNLIVEKLNITIKSLNTNLSYLRRGRIGNKKVKKLLKISEYNNNVTVLLPEIKNIIYIVKNNHRKLMALDFKANDV